MLFDVLMLYCCYKSTMVHYNLVVVSKTSQFKRLAIFIFFLVMKIKMVSVS